MNIDQKIVDYFLLNSVSMTADHVLNQLPNDDLDISNKYFMRGLLGQLKLKESIIGGSDDTLTEKIVTSAVNGITTSVTNNLMDKITGSDDTLTSAVDGIMSEVTGSDDFVDDQFDFY